MKNASSVVALGVYQAAHQMSGIVIDSAEKGALTDLRLESVDPLSCQTTAGLYLECNNGLPVAFWTPWGRWYFCRATRKLDSAQADHVLRVLMASLWCNIHLPEDSERKACVGPVYAIKVFGDFILPQAALRSRRKWLMPEEALSQWNSQK